MSGTTVSMATKCLRQSILNERFRTEGQNEAMLIGTLLHDLFDLAMEFNGEFSSISKHTLVKIFERSICIRNLKPWSNGA